MGGEGPSTAGAALALASIVVLRDGQRLLGPITWTVEPRQRWVVLGPNGCGKSTLFRVASMHLHPTEGTVQVLGERLGRTDVRRLRTRVGYASAALADSFRPAITCRDVVMTARYGALEPWWHQYTDEDRSRAERLLADRGCGDHADRSFGTLSSGERQRVLFARTLMTDPGVVLLDEPTAALDLAGRETLLDELDRLAGDARAPAMALVTHHVEEIPARFTHMLMMKRGVAVAAGPVDAVLDDDSLTETFEVPLRLVAIDGRRFAVMRR